MVLEGGGDRPMTAVVEWDGCGWAWGAHERFPYDWSYHSMFLLGVWEVLCKTRRRNDDEDVEVEKRNKEFLKSI